MDWAPVVSALSKQKKTKVLYSRPLIDVLNRFADLNASAETVHVMKYIFPRQFGLQNVFASTGYGGSGAQFNASALREQEISAKVDQKEGVHARLLRDSGFTSKKLPKRLRGQVEDLVRALRVRHTRCSYLELLNYYCPLEVSIPTQWTYIN